MLIIFLIILRGGVEAVLIVGIVAGFLKQPRHSWPMLKVWLGVALAVLMCLGIEYGVYSVTGEIPQKEQEFVVDAIGLVAAAMLTYMILWMEKNRPSDEAAASGLDLNGFKPRQWSRLGFGRYGVSGCGA